MDTKSFIFLDLQSLRLICRGEWNLENLAKLKTDLNKITWPKQGELTVDGDAVTKMDSAGAWLLNDSLKEISSNGLKTQLQRFSEQAQELLALIAAARAAEASEVPVIQHINTIEHLGRAVVQQLIELRDFLSFTGELAFEFIRGIFHPARWRWNELAAVIDKTGFQALPIIALLSFMIGVVISYQMGNQLRNYGANVFIVNLLGLSACCCVNLVLRLQRLCSFAGRTGLAFTAQLGIRS